MTQVVDRFLNAKPVVRHEGEYFKIKDLPVEILGNHSFNWFKKDDPTGRVEREDTPCQLKVLQQKKTYHKSTELFFKPDVEEVLNQIPEELLGKKIYFSTAPFGDGTVRYQDVHALDEGYATGCTTFYEECESESSQCNIL
ncbi:hypothetical protein [Endozoicomonas sp. ONNA2]|uniref:hypothetical protein n=1 Tax=Endozoicomonas sp. ONNA2 TaxID=2828741 RepID=UPI002148153B|nr:hypothetical protein [Endozoicomonas sp. ONNA2]